MLRKTRAVIPIVLTILAAGLYAKKKKPEPVMPQMSGDQKVIHALNRLTFGPRPGDVEAVKLAGLDGWIEKQLHPRDIPENPALETKLARFETLSMSPADVAARFARKQTRNGPVAYRDLSQSKLLRAVYSDRQLEEVLTDFWYNHFNVFFDKGADRFLATAYERDVIRPHVLGRFEDLLLATAESPAMLFYLDNWQSTGPAARRRQGLNENYGRELLELHTLGVDSGYTQQDVTEVARCFTGWTIRDPRGGGDFEFNARLHDTGEKHVLGVTIPAGGGMDDGLKVIGILAHSPAAAKFISRNLAMRFVSDDPPNALVESMSKRFLATDGDLREVMRAMIDSPEFRDPAYFGSKIKSPLELVASALRSVDADVDFGFALVNQLNQMGEPLYRKLEPTGYSNGSTEWMNSAALLARMNFAVALTQGKIPGVTVEAGHSAGGLTLGSPEFQRR
jgi:uncharacterized protein (DUF1800 family)